MVREENLHLVGQILAYGVIGESCSILTGIAKEHLGMQLLANEQNEKTISGLIGKAGESLVAAELMRRGAHVAIPAYDGGIDLLAYSELNFKKVVPIQVKTRAGTGYNFQKSWFKTDGLVLVQVWHVSSSREIPGCYIFRNISDVEDALGPTHSQSPSWLDKGGYNVTDPGDDILKRMQAHRDRWERILDQLIVSH